MQEKNLLRLALITSFIGIASLFIILSFAKLEAIDSTDDLETDSAVRIIGTVEEVSVLNNVTRLTISYDASVDAVVFESLELSVGQEVDLTGSVSEFKGRKEVIVDKLLY